MSLRVSNHTGGMNTRHVPLSATLGIDLASQPKRTAACCMEWQHGRGVARLVDESKLDDDGLLEAMKHPSVTKIAIDAPFGWPTEFVRAINSWHHEARWTLGLDPGEEQLPLVLRATDRDVWRGAPTITGEMHVGSTAWLGTGRRPLSVSADRIAFAAMRCARLLHAFGVAEGKPVDRSGRGRVLEVYPEAALRQWKISSSKDQAGAGGYKGSAGPAVERRARLINRLANKIADVVDLDAVVDDCVESDDALDAVVCALIARAAEVGALLAIGDQDLALRDRSGFPPRIRCLA